MRSNVASAVLAAAFVLAPAVAGYAPALSQDFSITNKVEGPAAEWTRKLQAWWDVHAYYPQDALENKEDGTVKLHLLIHEDGEVWTVKMEQGSGSRWLDRAGKEVFHRARLPPFPPNRPVPQADVDLTLHYVLAHQASKSPFTIGNDPVQGTVVDTMLQKTCTGTAVLGWAAPRFGPHVWVQATWFRRPDGTKWIRWYENGNGPDYIPVTELGVSAQWTNMYEGRARSRTHFELWPEGDNRIGGKTEDPQGIIELTCE